MDRRISARSVQWLSVQSSEEVQVGDPILIGPDIRYADADGVQVAYQRWGKGDDALIIVPGLISNIDLNLETAEYREWIERLSKRMQVIVFDKRGQGLSDRTVDVPGPEQRMDDVSAVARAVGLEAFSLFGNSEGAATALLYAATYPDHVRKVCVFGGFARFSNAPGYDHMFAEDQIRKSIKYWGTGASGYSFVPDQMPAFRNQIARYERACCTPNGYRAMLETNFRIDIRAVLGEVKVPVLVMHRRDDRAVPVANGRYLADSLSNADYIEFATGGHIHWFGDGAVVAAETEKFLLAHHGPDIAPPSVLATVLFTDIVDSSAALVQMGDIAWRNLLDRHDRRSATLIEEFGGVFVKSTGDGLLATFDGPGRAVRCAKAMNGAVGELGVKIRAGLHIGEVQHRGEDIAGMAVHVAARVLGKADPETVIITGPLNDLIAGSGLKTRPAGEHELKGLPGIWPLFSVA